MRCTQCGWKYPNSLLNNMMVSAGYIMDVCGICALAITNEISGVTRESFQGEQAEAARIGAVAWRNSHPADKPVTH